MVTRAGYAYACVEGVPPEEFGISRHARSIGDAGYAFHEVARPQAELIAMGFDREAIDRLPAYVASTSTEAQARDTVEEGSGEGADELNRANRLLKVTEHYVRMDFEGDGKPRLYRVTTGGDDGMLLTRDGEPDVSECDMIPFAAMTPVMSPASAARAGVRNAPSGAAIPAATPMQAAVMA